MANAIKNPDEKPGKNILTFQTYVENKQESLLKHLVRAENSEPETDLIKRHPDSGVKKGPCGADPLGAQRHEVPLATLANKAALPQGRHKVQNL